MDKNITKVISQSNTDPMTLTRHLIQSQQTHKEATGDFTMLLSSIQTACKFIDHKIRKGNIANLYGLAETGQNSTGDEQKKLDVLSNDVFVKMLKSNRQCAILASEEEETAYIMDIPDAKYVLAFDPLE
jgi:fructose-1,6-bisphosphatase I